MITRKMRKDLANKVDSSLTTIEEAERDDEARVLLDREIAESVIVELREVLSVLDTEQQLILRYTTR